MTRSASPQLKVHLATARSTLAFDLWMLQLQNGQVYRWTNSDRPIAAPSGLYERGPVLERGQVTWRRGLEVDDLDLSIKGGSPIQINGRPIVQFAAADGFSGARVLLRRAFLDTNRVYQGELEWFAGTVHDVELDRYDIRIKVKSDLAKLDVQMPRNLFQPGCGNTLFDARCGLNEANYEVALSVQAVDPAQARSWLRVTNTSWAAGYFALGILRFVNGNNAGISRTVKTHWVGPGVTDFAFARQFPLPIGVNDGFIVTPGCDKTAPTCRDKFHNTLTPGGQDRFTGTPFIPAPEVAT